MISFIVSILFSTITIFIAINDEANQIAILFGGISILCLFIAGWKYQNPTQNIYKLLRQKIRMNSRQTIIEIGLISLLTILALVLRTYDLVNLPRVFHGDEGEIGMLARKILTGSKTVPPFSVSWFKYAKYQLLH